MAWTRITQPSPSFKGTTLSTVLCPWCERKEVDKQMGFLAFQTHMAPFEVRRPNQSIWIVYLQRALWKCLRNCKDELKITEWTTSLSITQVLRSLWIPLYPSVDAPYTAGDFQCTFSRLYPLPNISSQGASAVPLYFTSYLSSADHLSRPPF